MAFTKRGTRLVEALKTFSMEKPNFFDTSNFFNKVKFTAANEDCLKAKMTVDLTMCNGIGVMHGGFMSLVLDVMSLYAYVAKRNGRIAYTTNMSVNFIGAARAGDKVIVEAKTVKIGSPSIVESTLYKDNGMIIAKCTASFVNGNEALQKKMVHYMGFDVLKTDE